MILQKVILKIFLTLQNIYTLTLDLTNVTGFKNAMLTSIDYTDINNMAKCETNKQRTLLFKLQTVHANNYSKDVQEPPADETDIDNFVHYLLSLLSFDEWPIKVRYVQSQLN